MFTGKQMGLAAIRQCIAVSEELYAAGHQLHAFATMYTLLGPITVIPPRYRREEVYARVRAAEMLLECEWAGDVEAARLDLVHSVLAPMFSRRILDNSIIKPLLWEDAGCPNGVGASDNSDGVNGVKRAVSRRGRVARKRTRDKREAQTENKNDAEDEKEENAHIVPISLVVRAHALNAAVYRRWLRYKEALRLLGAAQQWCATTFKPLLSAVSDDEDFDSEARCEEEEKNCCEAYIAAELCRLYHTQLTNAVTSEARNQMSSTMALHQSRRQALEGLLYTTKDYAKYARPPSNGSRRSCRTTSALCLSSTKNSFSLDCVVRLLSHYHCAALVLSCKLMDVEQHFQKGQALLGISPEFCHMQDLLAMGCGGPWRELSTPSNDKSHDQQRNEAGGSTSNRLRWVSDGVLGVLHNYMELYTAVASGSNADPSARSDQGERVDSRCDRVQVLFQSTLKGIDEQMTLLTTAASHNTERCNTSPGALSSSPSSNVRFLLLLKCSAILAMASHNTAQLCIGEAIRCLSQLRRYMGVFVKDTQRMRPYYHLLAAQIASMLSLRHLPECTAVPGVGVWTTSGDERDGEEKCSTISSDAKQFMEPGEEDDAVGFDVGLSYAHIRAAAKALERMPYHNPTLLPLASLMKGAVLHHASHRGSVLRLTNEGFTVSTLPINQRRRCAAALVDVVEALTNSEAKAAAQKDAVVAEETEEVAMCCEGEVPDQLQCAWNADNKLFLLLLRGVVKLTEERDEITAKQIFALATSVAVRHFHTVSPATAECLYRLSMAMWECERGQLRLPLGPPPLATLDRSVQELLADEDIAEGGTERSFTLAAQLASCVSRLVMLRCAYSTGSRSKQEDDWNTVVDQWNSDVHHVCTVLREELVKALSL
uniref:Uncharacterized protein TCIL3000_10_13650 n=1 Tax=Trypanosoma congolense (strain IL3000) TaxID=1068625 RepID=G0UYW2_TRYCI|nr:unnamed protein product [Trypanosoma congolense IL3000]